MSFSTAGCPSIIQRTPGCVLLYGCCEYSLSFGRNILRIWKLAGLSYLKALFMNNDRMGH
jgi:hypothetical protein